MKDLRKSVFYFGQVLTAKQLNAMTKEIEKLHRRITKLERKQK